MHKLQLMTVKQVSVFNNILPYMAVCFTRLTLQIFPVDLLMACLSLTPSASLVAMQAQSKICFTFTLEINLCDVCVCKRVMHSFTPPYSKPFLQYISSDSHAEPPSQN